MKKVKEFKATKKTWLIFIHETEAPRAATVFEGFQTEGCELIVFENQSKWEFEKRKLNAIDLGELK